MKKVLLLVMSALSIEMAGAQTWSGRIVDERGEAVAFANVVLLGRDSTFLDGNVSDQEGAFRIEEKPGESWLKISYIGYKDLFLPLEGEGRDLGAISLRTEEMALDEVVVRGTLPVTRLKGDALVTSVENSMLAEVGSANDVLAKIPGLTRGEEGFEVFGKGEPLIYINGRKLRDKEELERLNSDEIRSVEVVTNPGAQYDATVKAVVRIQTKRRKGEGFGFDVRSSYYQSMNTDLIETLNANYRKDDWDFFGTLNYSHDNSGHTEDISQENQATDTWTQKNFLDNTYRSNRLDATVGFNVMPREGHSMGARYAWSGRLHSPATLTTTSDVFLNGQPYDHLLSHGFSDNSTQRSHDLNAYYNGRLGELGIDLNLDYYKSTSEAKTDYLEESSDREDRDFRTINPLDNQLAAAKLVFTYPLGGGELSWGAEYTYTNRTDDYLSGAEEVVPTSYSQIKEHNVAAFAEWKRTVGILDLSAGLRYEHDEFKYYADHTFRPDQSRTYDNLFPNAAVGATLGNVHAQLSYNARTRRPYYYELSNNTQYINRFTMRQGTPTLRPAMTHDVSLTATWRFLQATVSYQRAKDAIIDWARPMEDDDAIVILGPRNFDCRRELDVMVSASPTVGPWSPTLAVGVMKQWFEFDYRGERLSMDRPIPIIQFRNLVKLPWGLTLSADLNVQGRGESQNFRLNDPNFVCDVSLRKSFLDDALSVEVEGTDLFRDNYQQIEAYTGPLYITDVNRTIDTREFCLTVRYKFNSTPSKYKGTGAGNAQKQRF